MLIRVIHTPVGTMGTEGPIVVAEVETYLSHAEAAEIIYREWKKFQASNPDSDSQFAAWLMKYGGEKNFKLLKNEFVDIYV